MADSVRVSGTWREADKNYIKVSGTWREIDTEYVKVNGVWREGWKGVWDSIKKSSWSYQHNNSSYGYITASGVDYIGNLYIGTNTGYIEKITPSGNLEWRSSEHRNGGRNRSIMSIEVDDIGMMYSSSHSTSGGWIARIGSNGVTDWGKSVSSSREYRGIASNQFGDAIVIDNGANILRSFSKSDGSETNNNYIGSSSSPTLYDIAYRSSYVYIGTSDRKLYRYVANTTGKTSYEYTASDNGGIYSVQIGGTEGEEYIYIMTSIAIEKIDPAGLNRVWRREFASSAPPINPATVRFKLVCGEDGLPIVINNEGGTRYLIKYDSNGNLLYKTSVSTSGGTDMIDAYGRYVYFFNSDGLIERWEH